jgi:hypothetical protein
VGLSYTEARQLLRARRSGASFASVLMIGRQNLHLYPLEIVALDAEFDLALTPVATPLGVYADDFLRVALGAERIDSIDASEHEGATIVHDLNHPVPTALRASY